MRLWHKDLLPILPRMQLLGQWRECCAIAKNINLLGSPNHILVNKIMDYPMDHFATYCQNVVWNMEKNDFAPNPDTIHLLSRYLDKRIGYYVPNDYLFADWHNDRYLYQCLTNLEEKFDCGGISVEEWQPLEDYILEHL